MPHQNVEHLQPDPHALRQLVAVSLLVHLLGVCILVAFSGGLNEISRDSYWYHYRGVIGAEQYALKTNDWSRWIDEGWREFIPLVYYLIGPNLLYILIVNAMLAAASATLLYRISLAVFCSSPVALASAYLFTLFPSFVYYTCLPLKEAPAVFGILCIVWGVVGNRLKQSSPWLVWLLAGFAIIAALRVYLVIVLAGCVVICFLPLRLTATMGGIIRLFFCGVGLFVLAYFVVDFYNIEISDSEATMYYDFERVNQMRESMSRGGSRLFQRRSDAIFSDNLFDIGWKVLLGLTFFIFSVDPFKIGEGRQAAALPELLFFLYCIPYLFHGVVQAWKRMPQRILPVFLIGGAIVLVYSSTTTNAGTMTRWRCQAIPYLVMLVVYGAAVCRRGLLYQFLQKLNSRAS